MLKYSAAENDNRLLVNLMTVLVVITTLIVIKAVHVFNLDSLSTQFVYFIALSVSLLIALPILRIVLEKNSLNGKGILEDTSHAAKVVPGFVEKQLIITDSYDTVFNALENELLGIEIKPMPLARTVWKRLKSDREFGKIAFVLPIYDAVKPGAYVRKLYLELIVENIGNGQVRISQVYSFNTPMMRKFAYEAIEQTDSFLRMILSTGTVKLPASRLAGEVELSSELVDSEADGLGYEIVELELPDNRHYLEEVQTVDNQVQEEEISAAKQEVLTFEYQFEPLSTLGELPQMLSDEYADTILSDSR